MATFARNLPPWQPPHRRSGHALLALYQRDGQAYAELRCDPGIGGRKQGIKTRQDVGTLRISCARIDRRHRIPEKGLVKWAKPGVFSRTRPPNPQAKP